MALVGSLTGAGLAPGSEELGGGADEVIKKAVTEGGTRRARESPALVCGAAGDDAEASATAATGGVCAGPASTVRVADPESWDENCAWAAAISNGGSAPTGVGAHGLEGAAIELLPAPGATCFPSCVSRLMAAASALEWASLQPIGASPSNWAAGVLEIVPTAAAAGSGEGITRNGVGGGRLSITALILSTACGTGVVTEGSASSEFLVERACESESESAPDVELALGTACEARNLRDFGTVLGDLAPVSATDLD